MENPIYSLARSYEENYQHENAGGQKFTGTKFFSSRSYSWFTEPTKEEVRIKSDELYMECVREVTESRNKKIAELKAIHGSRVFPKTKPTSGDILDAKIEFEMNEQAALEEAVENGDMDREEVELFNKIK